MEIYKYQDLDKRGTIERVCYTAHRDGDAVPKYANVYLPYGYDAADKEKRYNILYMMHGGGGNPDAWLDSTCVKNMLDTSFATGRAEPMIVVFPSFYKAGSERTVNAKGIDAGFLNACVYGFQEELGNDVIPAVEKIYNTYAQDVTPEALEASRDHRAFGGFSMGASTTWYAFLHNMRYISRFMPISGDCWIIEPMGGRTKPVETAKAMREKLEADGFGPEDFKIFAVTGTGDIAHPQLTPLVDAMKQHPDFFRFSEDLTQGNLHYTLVPDWIHAYEVVANYIYYYLPYIF